MKTKRRTVIIVIMCILAVLSMAGCDNELQVEMGASGATNEVIYSEDGEGNNFITITESVDSWKDIDKGIAKLFNTEISDLDEDEKAKILEKALSETPDGKVEYTRQGNTSVIGRVDIGEDTNIEFSIWLEDGVNSGVFILTNLDDIYSVGNEIAEEIKRYTGMDLTDGKLNEYIDLQVNKAEETGEDWIMDIIDKSSTEDEHMSIHVVNESGDVIIEAGRTIIEGVVNNVQ